MIWLIAQTINMVLRGVVGLIAGMIFLVALISKQITETLRRRNERKRNV